MTGLGMYQKGLELEGEGKPAAQIAKQLGYSSTQAWYAAKSYYSKKTAAFNARAAGKAAEPGNETMPKVETEQSSAVVLMNQAIESCAKNKHQAEVEQIADADKPLKQAPQFAPKSIPGQTPEPHAGLKMEIQITAEGKSLRYRLNNTQLLVNRHNARHNTLVLSIQEAMTMLEELKEMLRL